MKGILVPSALLMLLALTPLSAAQSAIYFAPDIVDSPAALFPFCGTDDVYSMREVAAPDAGAVDLGGSTAALGCTTSWTYSPSSEVTLTGDGTFFGYFACDLPMIWSTPATLAFRVIFLLNGEELNRVETGPVNPTCSGSDDVSEVSGTVGIGGKTLSPSDELRVDIILWHTQIDGLGNALMLVGGDFASRIEAPGLPGAVELDLPADTGASVFYNQEEESVIAVAESFGEASSDTYVYNWTTAHDSFNATTITQVVNGSAQLSIIDGAGTTLLEALYTADFNSTESFEGVTPGNWTILVEYDDFVGNFALTVAPNAPPPADDTTDEDDGSGDGDETGDGEGHGDGEDHSDHDHGDGGEDAGTDSADGEGSDAPGFGILGLLALLGAAFVARRR
ncbi:MAG: hypothetical protein ACPGQL_00335 [Thermoplasmatota archaeon]